MALVLARKMKKTPEDKDRSRVTISKDGQVIGTVQLLYAAGGVSRLGFEFLPDYKIVRDELCGEGKSGKEAA